MERVAGRAVVQVGKFHAAGTTPSPVPETSCVCRPCGAENASTMGVRAAGRLLEELAAQAEGCRNCDLWRDATQVVFGEGPPTARMMLVGEPPGDAEDLAGRP